MSKLETPMTLWFWHQVGDLLIEEFVAVRRTASQGQRLIDAVIVLGEKKRRLARGAEFDLAGRAVIAVQSKYRFCWSCKVGVRCGCIRCGWR